MRRNWLKHHAVSVALAGAMLILTTSCGTLLHPERKGQQSGRIDVGIAVLNAIGLLFFVIPGVIAFAVDFSNGTIYLPAEQANLQNMPGCLDDMVAIHVDKQKLTERYIESLIRDYTGKNIDLGNPDVQITSADNR